MNIEELDDIRRKAHDAAEELCIKANLQKNDILVVGCSSSEVTGNNIGTSSSPEVADAIYEGIQSVLIPKGIYLAAQCCEHLNRAIIIEESAAGDREHVNVVPQPKAGGSFATKAYHSFIKPVVLEHIQADAGIDIGGTLIGMHLKNVAVPVRLKCKSIGNAGIICARTRPKFIGGIRAAYNENLL